MVTYNRNQCVFCNRDVSNSTLTEECASPSNTLRPDTVGRRYHGVLRLMPESMSTSLVGINYDGFRRSANQGNVENLVRSVENKVLAGGPEQQKPRHPAAPCTWRP